MKKFIEIYVGTGFQLEITNDITEKEIEESIKRGIYIEDLMNLVGSEDIRETDSQTRVLKSGFVIY
jgi:hypothetical protein